MFSAIIIHNLSREAISVPANSLLGTLNICSLTRHVVYKPMCVLKAEFDKFAGQQNLIKNYETRQVLCDKLSALIGLKDNRIQDKHISELHEYQEKQIYITSLVQEAGIHTVFLPRDVKGKIKFDFSQMLNNLNTILLSQYLQRTNNCLETNDIISIQNCDPILSEIVRKLQTTGKVNDKFVIREKVLFKLSLIYGMKVFRLCLPVNLAREVLTVMHRHNKGHMSVTNLRLKFRANF